jgi:steroid 5-alpha reductase family enzyme
LVAAASAFLCWLLAVVFDEYSWTDRLWSVVPPIYIGLFAWQADPSQARLWLMTGLATLWGLRLTFNYARKGGYARGGEDYRWSILRTKMSPWQWQLFNLLFIAGYQHLLLFLIALPAWTVWGSPRPLGPTDALLAASFLSLLALETVADQQQWNFHQEKARRKAAGQPVGPGFLDQGLWAWSRHPNFFAEQGQWWVIYGFAVAATGQWLHPTLVGPVLLTLLFDGSTRFTEGISASRYPEYADYQRRVSRLIPWLPRRSASGELRQDQVSGR